ncbi:MAG: hypothetical protein HOV76_11260 [Hamadaea sp.]|nr:hypothetical protein [Hamadaea sp.]
MSQHPGQRAIYDFLRAQIGDGVDLEDVELPDEEHVAGRVKFAAGAWDGVISHHAGGEESAVGGLFAAVEAASTGRWRTRRRFERLYERAKDPDLLGAIDPLLGRIRGSDIGGWRLHTVAMRLATASAHRGPVKLGIALLGLFPADLHREVLLTLGRHDEFTL